MISNNFKKRFYTSLVLLTLVILILKFDFILIYSLIVLGVISILEFLDISKKYLNTGLVKYSIIPYLLSIYLFFVFCFFSSQI